MTNKTPYEHFIVKVNKTAYCWLWTAHIHKNGYGTIKSGRKMYLAHRFSYELYKGKIPTGLQIDHLCRVRHCVNPDHLEAVTAKINMYRGDTIAAKNIVKTHCPRGHEYDDKNTYRWRGRRICRPCGAISQLAYTARKQAIA